MRVQARELKADAKTYQSRGRRARTAGSDQGRGDRKIASPVSKTVAEVAADLLPRTWYGMPAWSRAGRVLCFLKVAGKFNNRYAASGFNDSARLDCGAMWPTAFALTMIDSGSGARLPALLRQALG